MWNKKRGHDPAQIEEHKVNLRPGEGEQLITKSGRVFGERRTGSGLPRSGPLHKVAVPAPEYSGTPPLLDMRGIVKRYSLGKEEKLTVLDHVDFAVDPGEFVSVVGVSGSGKSTLMNIIGMLDKPTEGLYFFDGQDVLAKKDNELAVYRSEKIGFVFQNFNLIGRVSALKNVEMPLMYSGLSRKDRREKAEELLAMVGMSDRMTHQPNELSGGQKQRVAIARALANAPELILADEPTGALDSATGRMVMDLFHELNQEQGKTIVFITHNPELAEETQRVVTMLDGRISLGDGNGELSPGQPGAGAAAAQGNDVPGGAA